MFNGLIGKREGLARCPVIDACTQRMIGRTVAPHQHTAVLARIDGLDLIQHRHHDLGGALDALVVGSVHPQGRGRLQRGAHGVKRHLEGFFVFFEAHHRSIVGTGTRPGGRVVLDGCAAPPRVDGAPLVEQRARHQPVRVVAHQDPVVGQRADGRHHHRGRHVLPVDAGTIALAHSHAQRVTPPADGPTLQGFCTIGERMTPGGFGGGWGPLLAGGESADG